MSTFARTVLLLALVKWTARTAAQQLLSAKFELSDDSTTCTLAITVDFTASQEPEISWSFLGETKSSEKTYSNGKGNTTITIQSWKTSSCVFQMKGWYSGMPVVTLKIKHLKRRYLELKVDMHKDISKTYPLKYTQMQIKPSTNISYAGNDTTVEVAVTHTGPVSFSNLHWIDNTTKKIISTKINKSYSTGLCEDQTKVMLSVTDAKVNGYIKTTADLFKFVDSYTSLTVTEHVFITVHEDTNSGPFPDNFLQVNLGGKCLGITCDFLCEIYGNAIQSFEVKEVVHLQY